MNAERAERYGGDSIHSRPVSPTTKTNAFPKFKPFKAATNQLSRSTMLRSRRPISERLLFVVSDDMKILLLLPEAAEETRALRPRQRWVRRFRRVAPSNISTFSASVVDAGTTARRVESGHVGKYGRTQASSHDQPVCFDGRLRRRSSEAAPPGGPLAVRGG